MPQNAMNPIAMLATTSAQPFMVGVPAGMEWNVNLRVNNLTAAAVTINVWVVPNGGTVGSATQVCFNYAIPANDARYPLEGIQLPPGASVWIGASANNAVQALLHGTQKSTSV